MSALIEFDNVCKYYQMGDTTVKADDHISMKINKGEFVAIVGQSGSGKSTCMNIIGCLDVPTAGTYRLNGRDVGKMNKNELAEIRNEMLGFIFQQYNLLPGMNATAEIVTESADNVLSVPNAAITRGNYVLVTKDSPSAANADDSMTAPDGYVYVKVETGVSDDDYIAITSGLTAEDTVAYDSSYSTTTLAGGDVQLVMDGGDMGGGPGGAPGGGGPGGGQ